MITTELTDPIGIRVTPDRPSDTAVLVLAGSSGRVETARAELLARSGAVAESIRWFGGPGQQPGPWEVPVELFQSRVAELRTLADRVVILGTSFGAEAALITAAYTPEVDAVIAFAPTDVVWAGIRPEGGQTSHWTVAGAALPYISFVEDWRPDTDPPAYRELYRTSWEHADPGGRAAAEIPVERIPRILLVAGGDDQVWPSVDHAHRIAQRRRAVGRDTMIVSAPEAGHRTILPGETAVVGGQAMARGGTPEADAALGERAWPKITELLGRPG
ncbi:acyl-CoA thioester hydrolase/BAAT C-terminal domain-containing protein [Microlunatus speluncae]|uniref:acyl-CoA thioester hydrolase/BAAT C-terminal domain-containing protein n=1 Tax=Microlunatus speluncae TaxID=2594267 RepID=UPI001C2DAC21|nr:acyl-CoA thioester hydrolase/BAAT C-terminal domain-containing protein [Microlunatus speluncae]